MTKPLQVLLDDDTHKRFKIWCESRNLQMAEFLRDVIRKCLEGFKPEEVISATLAVETCSHVEMTTAGEHVIRLPIPNIVQPEGDHKVITVPDDTPEEDIELISTIPNTVVKTKKDWKTEIPLEVVK